MKTELRAKFLQHLLSKKKKNEGFTLIELLVVVIIIGILAAIALPSMLNQANKARESSAQSQVGAINRAQQAYRLEKAEFAESFADLGVGNMAAPDGYTTEFVDSTAILGSFKASSIVPADRRSFIGCVKAATGVTTATVAESAAGAAVIATCPAVF